jgi:hypothetical protein
VQRQAPPPCPVEVDKAVRIAGVWRALLARPPAYQDVTDLDPCDGTIRKGFAASP